MCVYVHNEYVNRRTEEGRRGHPGTQSIEPLKSPVLSYPELGFFFVVPFLLEGTELPVHVLSKILEVNKNTSMMQNTLNHNAKEQTDWQGSLKL